MSEHSIMLLRAPECDAARDLAAALAKVPGVTRVYVDLNCAAIYVEHRTEQVTRDDLRRIVAGCAEVTS